MAQQLPHGVYDGRAVGVEQQAALQRVVPRHMQITNLVQRQLLQIIVRIKTVVDAVHINIVHIQVQQAISLLHHGADKRCLAHVRARWRLVIAGVFYAYALA